MSKNVKTPILNDAIDEYQTHRTEPKNVTNFRSSEDDIKLHYSDKNLDNTPLSTTPHKIILKK